MALAVGAQSRAYVQQTVQLAPGLKKAKRVSGVMLRASLGQGIVGLREVSEGMKVVVGTLVSVSLCWAIFPVKDPHQVLALLE